MSLTVSNLENSKNSPVSFPMGIYNPTWSLRLKKKKNHKKITINSCKPLTSVVRSPWRSDLAVLQVGVNVLDEGVVRVTDGEHQLAQRTAPHVALLRLHPELPSDTGGRLDAAVVAAAAFTHLACSRVSHRDCSSTRASCGIKTRLVDNDSLALCPSPRSHP